MVLLTNAEMANMHFLYGLANGNALEARRLYAERYPENHLPCSQTFTMLHLRLQDTGTFARSQNIAGRPRTTRTVELEEDILQIIHANPRTSTRKIANEVNACPTTVWNVLKENLLYPYHVQRVQALLPDDYDRRMQWCQWFSNMSADNPNFSANILFTDEANFSREAIMNFHNTHIWSQENPHAITETRFQHQFSLNVWAGIIGDYLIGPYFLPQRLTGELYHQFIQNDLPGLLEDVPLRIRTEMWYMHDGAPAHFALNVRQLLNARYQNKWIGRGGPQPWPPRSPDINPLDYFLWGHLKELVYTTPIENVEDLRDRIIDASNTIRNNRGIFERVRQNLIRRTKGCIMARGGHFQQFL